MTSRREQSSRIYKELGEGASAQLLVNSLTIETSAGVWRMLIGSTIEEPTVPRRSIDRVE